MGPAPAVAAARSAVRRCLADYDIAHPVFVACSGGADSTALAAAASFEAIRTGRACGLITVDHGLQAGSAEQAGTVARFGYELGLDPVHLVSVPVGRTGGPEAAARQARYQAFERLLQSNATALILLGHTADDQAETVLLGLGRGSGPRSIAAMRPQRGRYLRPFLHLRRADTAATCHALGLPTFEDPHNADPRYRRVRVRREVLPLLEEVLSGGVVPALARTASQLHDDLDALDQIATEVARSVVLDGGVDCSALAGQPRAVISRVLKSWAEIGGAPALSARHIGELVELITAWHGQGPICLPGGVSVVRQSGRLTLSAST